MYWILDFISLDQLILLSHIPPCLGKAYPIEGYNRFDYYATNTLVANNRYTLQWGEGFPRPV